MQNAITFRFIVHFVRVKHLKSWNKTRHECGCRSSSEWPDFKQINDFNRTLPPDGRLRSKPKEKGTEKAGESGKKFFYMTFPSCKVFTAFENIQCSAGRAEFDGVLARISVETDNTQLGFSHFWQEQSWTTAVNAATEADIIVVSLSGRVDLPVPVKRWMETWPLHDRASLAALVVVFESGREELPAQNDLIAYCQKLAEQHGLSFFCNRGGLKSFAGELSPFQSNHPDTICCTE